MSSPADSAPILETPVPNHLKALFELEREAHASILGIQFWRENWFGLLALVVYGYIGWNSPAATGDLIYVLAIVFLFDFANEQRNRRRLKLLVEVLYGLQRTHGTSERA